MWYIKGINDIYGFRWWCEVAALDLTVADIHTPRAETGVSQAYGVGGNKMPFEECTMDNGKKGVRYGSSGKCYASREEAEAQAQAIHASGWTEKSMERKLKKDGDAMDPMIAEAGGDRSMAHDRLTDETEGAERYSSMAQSAKDPKFKELLQELAADELGHVKKLTAWIEAQCEKKKEEGGGGETQKSAPASKRLTVEIAKVAGNVVYGVVLHANKPDLQGDIMSAEDIRTAMHGFMEEFRTINKDHADDIDACPVECWQATEPGKLGETEYWPGSWLMGSKINDPSMLASVNRGEYKSYSIEGSGVRVPLS
jgi:rubrerythrin